jgi:hypothetical protein
MIPNATQDRMKRPTWLARTGLLVAAVLVIADPCSAGYTKVKSGKKVREGVPIEEGTAEYDAVKDALEEIAVQSVSEVWANRRIMQAVSEGMLAALGKGNIDQETNADANKKDWGATLPDKQPGIVADKINIDPALLAPATEIAQDYLKSTLFHEAIHALGATGEKTPLLWEKFLLENVKEVPATDSFLKTINNQLNAIDNPTPGGTQGGGQQHAPDRRSSYRVLNTLDSFVHAIDPLNGEEIAAFPIGFQVPIDPLILSDSQGRTIALLVSGTDITEAQGGITLLRDIDHDGWVDPPTAQYLAPPGSLRAPVDLAWDAQRRELYVLDSVLDQIVRFMDTNFDGLPDTRAAQPFAAAPLWPIEDALSLQDAGPSRWLLYDEPPWFAHVFHNDDISLTLYDLDGDGLADAMDEQPVCEMIIDVTPTVFGAPMHGDDSIGVQGQLGADVEVWAMSAGVPIEMLGVGVVSACDAATEIALSRALAAGESLRVVTPASAEPASIVRVTSRHPEILDAQPRVVTEGMTLVLSGRYFIPGSEVWIADVQAPVIAESPNQLVVEVPALNPDLVADLALVDVIPPFGEVASIAITHAGSPVYTPDFEPGLAPLGVPRVRPNPSAAGAEVEIVIKGAPTDYVSADVYAVDGRRVRTLGAAPDRLVWDGRDASGQRMQPGVYLLKVRAGEIEETLRVTIVP